MDRMKIAAIFADQEQLGGKEITVCGWARTIRDMKTFGFIELNDGSCFRNLQVVMSADELHNYKEIAGQNVGAALIVRGTVVLTPEAKQPLELRAAEIAVEGRSTPDYPLQKKRHSVEFLRTIQHLRPRTNLFSATFRVRSAAAYAVHEFFQSRGFVYVHTPIITGSDCEGAGEMFQVTTLDFTHAIPSTALKTFQSDKSIKAYNQPGGNTLSFTIPEWLDHFGQNEEGNLRRQAISMSIDRKTIAEKIFNNTSTPAVDFIAAPISAYSKNLKGNEVLKYNPKKAKELWAKANAISPWSGEFGIAYNADGTAKNWVEAICNYIKNTLDIDAKSIPMSTSDEFLSNVDSGKMTSAYRSGWGPDYPSADNYLVQLYDSSSADGKGGNSGNYKNPAFDAMMDKALSAPSTEEADKYYQQGEEILLQDLPAIPLWNQNATAASTSAVSGVEFDYGGGPVFTALTKKQ